MESSAQTASALKELSRWRESDRRPSSRKSDFPSLELGLAPFELVHHAALPTLLLEQYDRKAIFFFSVALTNFDRCPIQMLCWPFT
jgi:hypothetical protein